MEHSDLARKLSANMYTQQWYMSYSFANSLRAGSEWNILILLASCQQICTHSNGICHTGLLTACEQDQDGTCMTYTTAVCAVKNP